MKRKTRSSPFTSITVDCSHCGEHISARVALKHISYHWIESVGQWSATRNNLPLQPPVNPREVIRLAKRNAGVMNEEIQEQNYPSQDIEHDDNVNTCTEDDDNVNTEDVDDDNVNTVDSDTDSGDPSDFAGHRETDDDSSDHDPQKLLYHVLRVWQMRFNVSVSALRVLLSILHIFLPMYGMWILAQPPKSGNPVTQIITESEDIMILAACPVCSKVYHLCDTANDPKGCFSTTKINNKKCWISATCTDVAMSDHTQARYRSK